MSVTKKNKIRRALCSINA